MIDLIPEEYYQQRRLELAKFKQLIVIIGLVIAILFVGLNYFELVVKNNIVQKKVEMTQQQLQQVRGTTTEVLQLKKQAETLQTKLNQKQEVMGQRVNWALSLQELKTILPATSWLDKYQVSQHKKFQLSGYALQREDLEVIIKRLKKSAYFTDIYVEMTTKTQLSQSGYPERDVFQYQLSGQVVPEG